MCLIMSREGDRRARREWYFAVAPPRIRLRLKSYPRRMVMGVARDLVAIEGQGDNAPDTPLSGALSMT